MALLRSPAALAEWEPTTFPAPWTGGSGQFEPQWWARFGGFGSSLLTKLGTDFSERIEEGRFPLRFLIRCIEGMHIPLHVGENDEEGCNKTQVPFFEI
jgi:hypothetical protein